MRLTGHYHKRAAFAGLTALACIASSAYADEIASSHVASEQNTTFTLLAVSVDGARTLPPASFAPDYSQYLTRDVSLDDLAQIADAITSHYRRAGYFLSRAVVPPQQPESGVARILVIEGHFDKVRIEGEGAELVAPLFAGLDNEPIASLSELEQRIARASDLPGIILRARIEPNLDDPAKHDLVIDAELREIAGFVSLDNRGTAEMGPMQAIGRVNLNSAFADRDQLSLTAFTLPEDTEAFGLVETAYTYIFDSGVRLGGAVSVARAHDGSDVASDAIGSDRESFGLLLEDTLVRTRTAGLWSGLAFDALHSEGDWRGGGGYEDDVRAVRVRLRGFLNDEGRSTAAFIQASAGLDVFGASQQERLRRSRFDADGQFFKINARLSHFQPLGRYFGVFGAVDAQWAEGPLLQSEEFFLGGGGYGRAYDSGELAGDKAIAASLEFRAGFDPSPQWISFLQGYLFADAGRVWNYNALDGSDALTSVGGGVRLTVFDRFSAEFEMARPLSRLPAQQDDRDWRQFVSVSAVY